MRFRAEQHLRRAREIRAVREQGRRIDCRAFTIWWRLRPAGLEGTNVASASEAARPLADPPVSGPRVCVIASTAAVGGAIQRNRAKRRLREVFRHQQTAVPRDCDVLLIARRAAIEAALPDLERAFVEACGRIAPAKLS